MNFKHKIHRTETCKEHSKLLGSSYSKSGAGPLFVLTLIMYHVVYVDATSPKKLNTLHSLNVGMKYTSDTITPVITYTIILSQPKSNK